jgi:hypothetical protein
VEDEAELLGPRAELTIQWSKEVESAPELAAADANRVLAMALGVAYRSKNMIMKRRRVNVGERKPREINS